MTTGSSPEPRMALSNGRRSGRTSSSRRRVSGCSWIAPIAPGQHCDGSGSGRRRPASTPSGKAMTKRIPSGCGRPCVAGPSRAT
jgi:hypothetical protein